MSKGAWIVDPRAFARTGGQRNGAISPARMARLMDVLANAEGEVVFEAQGSRNADGKLFIDLVATGLLNVVCQRCLGAMAWPVSIQARFALFRPGVSIPDDELFDDSVDALTVEDELDIAALVEDEILLQLPLAPRHEECVTPDQGENAAKGSPFAALLQIQRKQ